MSFLWRDIAPIVSPLASRPLPARTADTAATLDALMAAMRKKIDRLKAAS